MTEAPEKKEHTLEYCKSLLEFNNSKIGEIDKKASFLTGISSVIFVLIVRFFVEREAGAPLWSDIIGFATVLSLVASFFYAIRVVIPATEKTQVTYKEPRNDFFCRWITDRSREEYRQNVLEVDLTKTLENYLNETYTLAEILNDKYKRVRRSSQALAVAITLLVLQLISHRTIKARALSIVR